MSQKSIEKAKGYVKPGEVLFVSVKYPQLSLVIHPGGTVVIGDKAADTKPRYVDFHPGFAGGEFRVNKATAKRAGLSVEALLEHLRERDASDDHYCEVIDSDHLAKLIDQRENLVADNGELKVVAKGQPKAQPAPAKPEPAKTESAVPAAAKGPGRKPKAAKDPVPA